MKRWLKLCVVFVGLTIAGLSTAYAQHVTENLMSMFTGMNSAFSGICLIVGIGLIFGAFIQYRQHRMNKLLVPISKPIFMFILGVVLVGVPILGHYTQGGQLVSEGVV